MIERSRVRTGAREVVFIGADKGPESVDFRGRAYEFDQAFARSFSLSDGLESASLLAYALSGEQLTREQGVPIRLVVPSWYEVSNVDLELFGGRLMDT